MVVGGGEPDVDYTYTAIGAGTDKNLRLTSVEYPSGRDIYYNYPSSGIGAALNRLDNIASSATPDAADKYAAYTYLELWLKWPILPLRTT